MLKLLLIFLLLPNLAFATTATFQDGVSSYTGTRDAGMYSFSDNENVTSTSTYNYRSVTDGYFYILYFDISSISTSATVTSATVQIDTQEQNCATPIAGVKEIQNPDASGAFTSAASAGDVFNTWATYHYKKHESTTKWSTGGSNVNFSDVLGNANESTVTLSACPSYSMVSFTVTNMVQDWVTTPTHNAGMVFNLTSSGSVRVHGKFYTTAANRPLLTVNYTTAGGVKKLMTLDGE